jgi:hypothetical protein
VDISREAFETRYFRDQIHRLVDVLRRLDSKKQPAKIFRLFYIALQFHGGRVAAMHLGEWYSTLSVLERFYTTTETSFRWPESDSETYVMALKNLDSSKDVRFSVQVQNLTDKFLRDCGLDVYVERIAKFTPQVAADIDRRAAEKRNLISELLQKESH